jgi:hypothetical protein
MGDEGIRKAWVATTRRASRRKSLWNMLIYCGGNLGQIQAQWISDLAV